MSKIKTKRIATFFSILICALGAFLIGNKKNVQAIDVAIQEGQDAYITAARPEENFNETANLTGFFGSRNYLPACSLIQFDLSEIPAGADIETARLRLFSAGVRKETGEMIDDTFEIGFWQITEEWDETEVTWENKPSYTIEMITKTSVRGESAGYQPWDITDLVKKWVEQPDEYPNHGIMSIARSYREFEYFFSFWSIDPASPDDSPVLNISYAPDATLPEISDIQAVDLSENEATIVWQTNEEATSWVAYGKDGEYTDGLGDNDNFVTNHEVTLSNLTPDTEYIYRVGSVDQAQNLALSEDDLSFKTSEPEPEPEVDDDEPPPAEVEETPTPSPSKEQEEEIKPPAEEKEEEKKPLVSLKIEKQKPAEETQEKETTEENQGVSIDASEEEKQEAIAQMITAHSERAAEEQEAAKAIPKFKTKKQTNLSQVISRWSLIALSALLALLLAVIKLSKRRIKSKMLIIVWLVLSLILLNLYLAYILEKGNIKLRKEEEIYIPPVPEGREQQLTLLEETIIDASYSDIYDFLEYFLSEEIEIEENNQQVKTISKQEAIQKAALWFESTDKFWQFDQENREIQKIKTQNPEKWEAGFIGLTEDFHLIAFYTEEDKIEKIIYLENYQDILK